MHPTTLLIVRHGPGRGRMPGYLSPAMAWLERTVPELHARVRLHATGSPLPSLEDAGAVWFALGDPLRERYPDCHAEAVAIEAAARARGARIVNAPAALSNTIKSVQAARWKEAGIPTPEVVRVADRVALLAQAGRTGYPVLIRGDRMHAQQGMHLCTSVRDLDRIPDSALSFPAAVSPLVDVRSTFPPSARPWARLHHKKRLLVLGGRVRTKHLFFSVQPVVTSESCTFKRSHRASHFARFSPALRACVREDLAYWRSEHEHDDLVRRAVGVLGLDFAAVDYSSTGDGGVLLWEANPYPSLPDVDDMMLSGWRQGAARVASYHAAIARFIADLLGAPPPFDRTGGGP